MYGKLICLMLTAMGAQNVAGDGGQLEAVLPSGWRLIQRVQGHLGKDRTVALVELIEADQPAKKPDTQVDNSSIPEHANPRRLRIAYVAQEGMGEVVREDLAFPSQTISGDPCSVRQLNTLSLDNHRLVVSIHYEQACGSGSGGDGVFSFVLVGGRLRLEVFEAVSASRDGDRHLRLDYGRGVLTRTNDAPEFDAPVVRRVRLPKPVQLPLITTVSLTRCPPPLADRPLPDCR